MVRYAGRIIDKTLKEDARYPWAHKWILDSLVNTVALAKTFGPQLRSDVVERFAIPYYVTFNPFRKISRVNEKEIAQVTESIHMDFENYSLTRLVGLSPYQTSSRTYKEVRALIEQRMYDLGYRYEEFADDDAGIAGNVCG